MVKPQDIPSVIFRGYDLRGLVGKELNEEIMELLGKSYATFLAKRRINETVIGCDNRLTSDAYKKAVIRGLVSCGINVYDFGLGLSQIMYFAQYYFRSKGGVFITASHNPKEYNGMKLAVGFSQTMITEEIDALRQIAQSGQYITHEESGNVQSFDIFPAYQEDLFKRIKLQRKFKVVIDGSNTAAGFFMEKILKKAGCEVIGQNLEMDGNFPQGTPDPTERKIQERLAERVLSEGADIGFSYDADGDRMGVVDEKGRILWNDTLVCIFAQDVLDFMPGSKIIYNALCSKAVTEVITQKGGIPIMWITGHSFIKAKVAEERAPFGGELSGHFFFMDNFYGHDDGAYSTLRILSYLERKNNTLGEVVATLPQYISSPEIKLGCPDEAKFKLVSENISQDLKNLYPAAEYVTIDGFRFDTKDKMAIIRASQNGPYITVKFEAKDQGGYDELKKQLAKLLQGYAQIDFSTGVNTESLL